MLTPLNATIEVFHFDQPRQNSSNSSSSQGRFLVMILGGDRMRGVPQRAERHDHLQSACWVMSQGLPTAGHLAYHRPLPSRHSAAHAPVTKTTPVGSLCQKCLALPPVCVCRGTSLGALSTRTCWLHVCTWLFAAWVEHQQLLELHVATLQATTGQSHVQWSIYTGRKRGLAGG